MYVNNLFYCKVDWFCYIIININLMLNFNLFTNQVNLSSVAFSQVCFDNCLSIKIGTIVVSLAKGEKVTIYCKYYSLVLRWRLLTQFFFRYMYFLFFCSLRQWSEPDSETMIRKRPILTFYGQYYSICELEWDRITQVSVRFQEVWSDSFFQVFINTVTGESYLGGQLQRDL